MERQVFDSWNFGWIDACLVPSRKVRLYIHDIAMLHPDVHCGDYICMVKCGLSLEQVLF
jgi:hypothetical protein